MKQVRSVVIRVAGALGVLAMVGLSTGCFGNPPQQSGVFVSRDGGNSWEASPDLRAKNVKKPRVYPPLAVTGVGVSPVNADLVVAGTDDNLYRSTDGAKTWSLLTPNIPTATKAMAVQGVTFHPTNPDAFYVYGVSGGYGKVLKTTNRGDSLQDVFTVSRPRQTVTSLIVDLSVPNTLYAGDQLGSVYKSADGATTWQRIFSTNQGVSALALSGTTLYVGTIGQGIFRSPDQGVTFAAVNNGLSQQAQTVWAMRLGPAGIYAGTETGLFLSRDGGGSWQAVGNPLPAEGQRVQAIASSPTNVYFAASAVVYRMTPVGGSFTPVQLKLAKNIFGLASTPANQGFFVAGVSNQGGDAATRFSAGLPGAALRPVQFQNLNP